MKEIERQVKDEKGLLGWSWILSFPTFFNSSFHQVAVGTVLNPLLEKLKVSKEKFAFILSVTSLQLILLIPLATANLGYMVSLIASNSKAVGVKSDAYTIVLKSILWNFFSWSMVLIALGVTFFSLGFGEIKLGKIKNDELTTVHIEKEKEEEKNPEEYPRRVANLIIPVIILLTSTIFLFWWTGRSNSTTFFGALSHADFNTSIFSGAFMTVFFTCIIYLFQKISLAEIQAHFIKGGEKIPLLVIVLTLSWALTKITQELGFNQLISENLIQSIPRFLLPAALFLLSGLISYTIGSSWATWALMMPLATTVSSTAGIGRAVMAGTIWAGGAVSDVVSPLSAETADISYGNHLVTPLPFVLFGVVLSTTGYAISGCFI